MLASDSSLRITEVFSSLQGESLSAGEPTTFIRLTGCPLRCVYCDSAYAFSGGEIIAIDQLLQQAAQLGNVQVCVTGGEPLAQPDCLTLLQRLCETGYSVSLETSGAIDISPVDSRVRRIMDVKTPSSGESDKNLLDNYGCLTANDELKFVIADRDDFDWSIGQVERHGLIAKVACVLFSPVFPLPDPQGDAPYPAKIIKDLAEWVLESGLPLRYQLQMHKLIWGDKPGH